VAAFTRAELESALPRFVGTIRQTPPAHSALKYQGRNYYEYARAGVEVPRAPREVVIEAIELVDWAPPTAVLRVACGKGTYMRVLAEDVAEALGSCAHLAALRRTAAGPFALDDAVTLEALESMDLVARDARLLPADAPLAALTRLDVDAPTARALAEGRIGSAPPGPAGPYRCYAPGGRFLGLVESAGGALRALRLARTDAPPGAEPRGRTSAPEAAD
jgi:tRNA pseudouridine55 synthase